MAQRLLHRVLLTIFFDDPNGTATVTQTSFGNFFWQSQWHSNCYTDFFWQFLLTIPMALRTMRKCYMNYCWIWKKTSKYCGHTGWLQRHKECKWKLKINKVLRTTAKMIHKLVPHTSKSHQNIVDTQANYESTKYSDEKSKSNKVLRTTAKLMHELLPDRKKVMETLRARRMIRLLPERYDLNRPLVG